MPTAPKNAGYEAAGRRFGWAAGQIKVLYDCNTSFADLCDDYQEVVCTLKRRRRASDSPQKTTDLNNLKLDLERELHRELSRILNSAER